MAIGAILDSTFEWELFSPNMPLLAAAEVASVVSLLSSDCIHRFFFRHGWKYQPLRGVYHRLRKSFFVQIADHFSASARADQSQSILGRLHGATAGATRGCTGAVGKRREVDIRGAGLCGDVVDDYAAGPAGLGGIRATGRSGAQASGRREGERHDAAPARPVGALRAVGVIRDA
jgi:hypothetical protein